MTLVARCLVLLVFPLLAAARGLNALFGRDPLRLSAAEESSFWLERGPPPSSLSYFSQSSECEVRGRGGLGRAATRILAAVAVVFAPRRDGGGQERKPALDRDQAIPDEIYTLW